jgi:hypothetical protein
MLRAHQSSGSRSLKHLSFPPVLRNAEAVHSPDDPFSATPSRSRTCAEPPAHATASALPPVEPTRSLPEPSQTQTQDWARTCRRPTKSCARELLILGILGSATHISHACTVEKQVLSTFFSKTKPTRKVFLLSHRTVPNEAGDHRAARTPPWQGAVRLRPPYARPPQV